MSIMGLIGTGITTALTAYSAYAGSRASQPSAAYRMAPGAGGRLMTGAVAGAAGYLAGSGNGNGMPRRRRAKGITGAELRGFNKTCRLLSKVGMVPRKLKGARTVGRKCK